MIEVTPPGRPLAWGEELLPPLKLRGGQGELCFPGDMK